MADKAGFKIAVASSDGIVVNSHFGRAEKFYIYEVQEKENKLLTGKREYREAECICRESEHDPEALSRKIQLLSDCRYVLVSRIGPGALQELEAEGIEAYELPGIIEESVQKLYQQIRIGRLFSV